MFYQVFKIIIFDFFWYCSCHNKSKTKARNCFANTHCYDLKSIEQAKSKHCTDNPKAEKVERGPVVTFKEGHTDATHNAYDN